MSDTPPQDSAEQPRQDGIFDRHPKLGIFAIAGVFYVILFGMCAFVAVLIWAQ